MAETKFHLKLNLHFPREAFYLKRRNPLCCYGQQMFKAVISEKRHMSYFYIIKIPNWTFIICNHTLIILVKLCKLHNDKITLVSHSKFLKFKVQWFTYFKWSVIYISHDFHTRSGIGFFSISQGNDAQINTAPEQRTNRMKIL